MTKNLKLLALLAGVLQVLCASAACAQETYESQGDEGDRESLSLPRATLERLANLTREDNLWLLVPSNVSEVQLAGSDFALFKLNTGQLFGGARADGWVRAEAAASAPPETPAQGARARAGRKLNLFKGVLHGKPQVSPLYLVNGTVCRFVNAQPVCTTLSTTGLFRGQNPSFAQQGGGLFQGANNNNQQQLPQPNQRGIAPQQTQNGQQFQQFRPAALLDDEQAALSVAAGDANLTSRAQQVLARPARPVGGGLQQPARRPLGLLSLGRPFRPGR